MNLFARVFGWFLVVFGLMTAAVEIDEVIEHTQENTAVGLVLMAVCLVGGILLIRASYRGQGRPVASADDGESRVFKAARQHAGRVTAVQVAAETGMSFEAARLELERLTKLGACEMDVTDAGGIEFRFADLEAGANQASR